MHGRKIVAAVGVSALVVFTAGTVSSSPGSSPLSHDEPNIVAVKGVEDFDPNGLIFSTFRFDPGTLRPHTGERVRLIDQDRSAQAPHSLTIVRPGQVPDTSDEVFSCGACNAALDRHFSTDPPSLRLNVGRPGLDQAGDSLLIFADQSIRAVVSADPGTALSFVCAFHPWMQGRILVG